MKLSRHARAELLILATLTLGSCGENASRRFTQGDYDRLERADINARNAMARQPEIIDRLDRIEQKLGM
jgi:hypothetical protein